MSESQCAGMVEIHEGDKAKTGRALQDGVWALRSIDLREFGEGRHRNVDDTPAGGGAGMVLRADIGARALSPGTNDPTTAVQAIDQLHDVMRRLIKRPFPSSVRRDAGGVVRLVRGVIVSEPVHPGRGQSRGVQVFAP